MFTPLELPGSTQVWLTLVLRISSANVMGSDEQLHTHTVAFMSSQSYFPADPAWKLHF